MHKNNSLSLSSSIDRQHQYRHLIHLDRLWTMPFFLLSALCFTCHLFITRLRHAGTCHACLHSHAHLPPLLCLHIPACLYMPSSSFCLPLAHMHFSHLPFLHTTTFSTSLPSASHFPLSPCHLPFIHKTCLSTCMSGLSVSPACATTFMHAHRLYTYTTPAYMPPYIYLLPAHTRFHTHTHAPLHTHTHACHHGS